MSISSRDSDGARFAFGDNWTRFLRVLNEDRIREAERSLQEILQMKHLNGKTFLDIGSGSGLFSLAARRLGARVHSFDYDAQSVACTKELRRRYFPEDQGWTVESGSALDTLFIEKLGTFDIVYSWGVLHHTGAMWLGIENAIRAVKPKSGRLFIAIYNDQGVKSRVWWLVKWFYNQLPRPVNSMFGYSFGLMAYAINILKYTVLLKPMTAIRPLLQYQRNRGMSILYDLNDWMGGFPYEFATYDLLVRYLNSRGFELLNGRRASSLGCHELVSQRLGESGDCKISPLV
jgi:SAM-dependent methyltransferase